MIVSSQTSDDFPHLKKNSVIIYIKKSVEDTVTNEN